MLNVDDRDRDGDTEKEHVLVLGSELLEYDDKEWHLVIGYTPPVSSEISTIYAVRDWKWSCFKS